MMKNGVKVTTVKSDTKHGVTAKNAPIVIYSGLFGYRFIGLNDLFDCLQIDDDCYYSFKIKLNTVWYHNQTLDRLYKYNSIYLNFSFRNERVPDRCKEYYGTLTTDIYNHLKSQGERVSKSKLRLVVKHLIKHISRLKFHKKYAIRYTGNPKHWKVNGKNLSWVYMKKVIEYLEDKEYVHNFIGAVKSGKEDVCSMLVVNPELINLCNGKEAEDLVSHIDQCLLPPEPPLVEIRDGDKNPRRPTKEERIEVDSMSMVVSEYCKFLSQKTISINGIQVPEIFFRRIATVDLDHGCRWYDDGTIQQEDATSRSSVVIDMEETVEVDYSSLHFSLAAEESGLDLKGKDPYDFPFEVEVDVSEVDKWREDYGFQEKYDPIRNLKKVALLTMFNAKTEKSAVGAISKALKDDYSKEKPVKRKFVGIKSVKVKELVKSLKAHNQEVAQYLMSGVGLRFQKLDSDMITYCIEKFMKAGEVCIPIHDSIIVKRSQKTFAVSVMESAYEHVMGSKVNCRIK